MSNFWRPLLVVLLAAGAVQGDEGPQVQVTDPESWSSLLATLGWEASRQPAPFRIVVADEPAAREAGFLPTEQQIRVASVVDQRDPDLQIFWQEPTPTPVFELPADAWVFTSERNSGAPLMAGVRRDGRGLLWLATPPGNAGYERFPYLLHALVDLGLQPPLRGSRLWAFFDSSYRLRADPDYLAKQWRRSGIMGLHIAAWHYYDPDESKASYLHKLITACRREGILAYAWLELPHVSEGFWLDHPECREQTAALQDAKLDWRKLVDLADPRCASTVQTGIERLLTSFDWDGINLGELYFESLHGPNNPARFTPMNDTVRAEAEPLVGFDPVDLFTHGRPRHWSNQPEAWQAFVDYRADLVLRLQEDWLQIIRAALPQTDIVVTQIDDQFDPRMRELLGADAARLLPLAEAYDFTLLVEDPAPLWSLGPERYVEIAQKYRPLAASSKRLAIDINIVERYQQTYPTRKQTGVELLQLVDRASRSFPRVALYFENSIATVDRVLLPYAASGARILSRNLAAVTAVGEQPFGVNWDGFATVDGIVWPLADSQTLWLPAGRHVVKPAATPPPGRILRFTGDLLSVKVSSESVAVAYESASRVIALLDRKPSSVAVDGRLIEPDLIAANKHWSLRLPRGRHSATVVFQ